MKKKKRYIWAGISVGAGIIVGAITLFQFCTGHGSLLDLCGEKEKTPPATTQIKITGVEAKDSAKIGTIKQHIGGEGNTQYNIKQNE